MGISIAISISERQFPLRVLWIISCWPPLWARIEKLQAVLKARADWVSLAELLGSCRHPSISPTNHIRPPIGPLTSLDLCEDSPGGHPRHLENRIAYWLELSIVHVILMSIFPYKIITDSWTRINLTTHRNSNIQPHTSPITKYSNYLQCFFYSFFTAVISTSILSHTIPFHLFISTYTVKLVAGTVL